MRVVSDFREAMWSVLQQGISSLDFDFVATPRTSTERLLESAPRPRLRARAAGSGGWLRPAACPTGLGS